MKVRAIFFALAAALPLTGWWYISASYPVHISSRVSASACFNNLRQINGAKATWAMEKRLKGNAVPSDADLFGPDLYIKAKPQCPDGGAYVMGDVDHNTTCSIPQHSLEAGDVYVSDEKGTPVVGAIVTLRDSIGVYKRAVSDEKGFAHLDAAIFGPEFVRASKRGMQDAQLPFTNGWPAKLMLRPR